MLTAFILAAVVALVFRGFTLVLLRAHKVSRDEDIAFAALITATIFLSSFTLAVFAGLWVTIRWVNA